MMFWSLDTWIRFVLKWLKIVFVACFQFCFLFWISFAFNFAHFSHLLVWAFHSSIAIVITGEEKITWFGKSKWQSLVNIVPCSVLHLKFSNCLNCLDYLVCVDDLWQLGPFVHNSLVDEIVGDTREIIFFSLFHLL